MRSASTDLENFLAANNVAWRTHLFTITLLDGTTKYRWTVADTSLVVGGFAYYTAGANAPIIKRGPLRQSSSLSVDTMDVTLSSPMGVDTFTIGGKTLGLLGAQGYFDGARLQIDHLIMPSPGDSSLGVISKWFEGRVAQVEPRGVDLMMRVKSEIEAFEVMVPRFTIQLQCGNALFDANCALVRATYTNTAAASGTPTTTVIQTTDATIGAKAANHYVLGVLTMTSGAASGQKRAVSAFSPGGTSTLTLARPLTVAPAAGDTFTVSAGCDRSKARCVEFSNLTHYRGFPHIPRSEGAR